MALRAFLHGAGKTAMRRIAVLPLIRPVAGGRDSATPLFEAGAVAAGVASRAPFFDGHSGLGRDAGVRSRPARGGSRRGNTPGRYGGTGRRAIRDAGRLERCLTAPRDGRPTRARATAPGLRTGGTPECLDRPTPVLPRHDTLGEKHDHEKGKAVPFSAPLRAGIAIPVDARGLPEVKCSCGNTAAALRGGRTRDFRRVRGRDRGVEGPRPFRAVVVRPAPGNRSGSPPSTSAIRPRTSAHPPPPAPPRGPPPEPTPRPPPPSAPRTGSSSDAFRITHVRSRPGHRRTLPAAAPAGRRRHGARLARPRPGTRVRGRPQGDRVPRSGRVRPGARGPGGPGPRGGPARGGPARSPARGDRARRAGARRAAVDRHGVRRGRRRPAGTGRPGRPARPGRVRPDRAGRAGRADRRARAGRDAPGRETGEHPARAGPHRPAPRAGAAHRLRHLRPAGHR